ncbi:hypothetical protein [uncultured Draconibacterium sp.]|uniref:hypothetical protein n=1 Tax=uncultured Draconibacterium sp. TaxID=1573823 RepID=UPI002AA91DAF|nr:hypothetical protein [uncultured Draconibacterium sp.]
MKKLTFALFAILFAFSSCQTNQSKKQDDSINFENVQVDGGIITGINNEADGFIFLKEFRSPPHL